MSTTFKLDLEGDRQLLVELAAGFARFGDEAASAIASVAPVAGGRYRGTIKATTFIGNAIVSGQRVRTPDHRRTQITTIVYTTSPLGHILEGSTRAHRIRFHNEKLRGVPKGEGSIQHPGSRRFPHFWPGLASVLPRAGAIIGHGAHTGRTLVNTRVL